jgi:muramoyltetrapeptide carboxypeptidase
MNNEEFTLLIYGIISLWNKLKVRGDILLGKRLKIGDTIGLVAPAGIESTDKIEKGIEKLKSLGFNIKTGKHIYDKWGYFAGKDEDRAEDIMSMFEDDEVHMVLCVRGGYGAMRIIPYLDFHKVKKNPKVFMGYSDITVLLNTMYQKEGLITFHGPMINSSLQVEETLESFLNTIMRGYEEYYIKNPVHMPMVSNTDKSAEGRIVGGNLSLICSVLGTPYEIDIKDKLLFIEEVGEAPYRIDRMLTQLQLTGKLKECAGIILGQFTDCDGEEEEKNIFTLSQVLEDRIMNLNKPVLTNFMCGHDNPKLVLPIGAKARLNCRKGEIEVLQAVVE